MPWVWTDELAELMDHNDAASAADLHHWKAQPVGLAVPSECDLVTFAHSLLRPPTRQVTDHAEPECGCRNEMTSAGPG